MHTITDSTLVSYIKNVSQGKPDYWSFRGKAKRHHAHSYFQYPAMMVPQMQGELIDAILQVAPDTKNIFDPFVGSGTVMTEAMSRGLNFKGQDINPLAILLCKTKSQSLNVKAIKKDFIIITEQIEADSSDKIDIDFKGIDKWFRKDVAIALSKIRRAIINLKSLDSRRFFWTAMAEAIRLNSNSRTSNFKLYTRTESDIINFAFMPIQDFATVSSRNITNLQEYITYLSNKKHLKDYTYKGSVILNLEDSRTIQENAERKYDLLVTSPPYGDNGTTVTYGQYSYLPLQWIQLSDIDQSVNEEFLKTTSEIDRRSLGGSKAGVLAYSETLEEMSSSVSKIIKELKDEPIDRTKRVLAFCKDLESSLTPILSQMKPNRFMVWTVGNRYVGGKQVPTDAILEEMLISKGCYTVERVKRKFPTYSKRMENLSNTMDSETILIMRTGSENDGD